MRPAHSVEKLEQMLVADPASKVFLPLGEQYRKAGQLERAAEVLRAGLEHNPGYAAAQVALARVLLEQGDAAGGRVLLTRVVREVPDNLLAQRLLDEAGGPLEEAPPAPEPGAGDPEAESVADALPDEPEPVWASTESLGTPPEPPVPEPGIWKADEEEVNEDDGPPVDPAPFETVRLSRDEIESAMMSPESLDASREDDGPPPEGDTPDGELWAEADPPATVMEQDWEDDSWVATPPQEEDDPDQEHGEPADEAFCEADAGDAGDDELQHRFESEAWPADDDGPESGQQAGVADDHEPMTVLDPGADEVHLDAPSMADDIAASPASGEGSGTAPDADDQPGVEEVLAQAAGRTSGLDPAESARLLSLARLYRRQGDLDRAAGVYRDVLSGEPDHDAARRELAEVCGEGLTEISDEDVIPDSTALDEPVQAATMESIEDARRRKLAFLRSWLEHIRSES